MRCVPGFQNVSIGVAIWAVKYRLLVNVAKRRERKESMPSYFLLLKLILLKMGTQENQIRFKNPIKKKLIIITDIGQSCWVNFGGLPSLLVDVWAS